MTTAAIVRAVETLGASPSALTINRWGIREIFAGIVSVNAPILKPSEHLFAILRFQADLEQCSHVSSGRVTLGYLLQVLRQRGRLLERLKALHATNRMASPNTSAGSTLWS